MTLPYPAGYPISLGDSSDCVRCRRRRLHQFDQPKRNNRFYLPLKIIFQNRHLPGCIHSSPALAPFRHRPKGHGFAFDADIVANAPSDDSPLNRGSSAFGSLPSLI